MLEDNTSVYYDRISSSYDTSRSASTETVEKLIRLLNIGNNSLILDMGCGTGNYTYALQPKVKSVIGIDISTGMLEQARAKCVDLVCGDVTHLPFESDSFDGAIAMHVLHHIKEKARFLDEAHRILRKQASIAIHTCSHQQIKAFWFYHYFPRWLIVDLARMPDSKEIASLLIKAGFSDVGIEICYQDVVVADETPERYLEKDYRNSSSTFAFLTEEDIELGCNRIRRDIKSGTTKDIVRESEGKIAQVGGSCIIYGRKART